MAMSARVSAILSAAGSRIWSRPAFSISPWEVLLMSSEVQAQWTNSVTALSSALAAMRSLMKYSTALTSWLVVFSMSLMRWASASLKPAAMSSSRALAAALKGGTSATPGWAARHCSQRISTITRYLIRPSSLKVSRSGAVLAPKRPSMGEMAGRGERFMARFRLGGWREMKGRHFSTAPARPRRSGLAAQIPGQFQEPLALKHQLVAPSPHLLPEGGGADGGEQQAADAVGDIRLAQVLGHAAHLDAEVEGAEGVEVEIRQIGDHIGVGAAEMLRLAPRPVDAFPHLGQHGGVAGEFALQVEHPEYVAQQGGIRLRAGGAEHPVEGVEAGPEGVDVAEHREGGRRVLFEQAVDAGLEIPRQA